MSTSLTFGHFCSSFFLTPKVGPDLRGWGDPPRFYKKISGRIFFKCMPFQQILGVIIWICTICTLCFYGGREILGFSSLGCLTSCRTPPVIWSWRCFYEFSFLIKLFAVLSNSCSATQAAFKLQHLHLVCRHSWPILLPFWCWSCHTRGKGHIHLTKWGNYWFPRDDKHKKLGLLSSTIGLMVRSVHSGCTPAWRQTFRQPMSYCAKLMVYASPFPLALHLFPPPARIKTNPKS